MTFLPVVERELRAASRRRGTYWSRFSAGVIGAALAAWVLLGVDDTEKKIGADLFLVVSALVFIYATVAGTLVTCDCLSEEKWEGTLGLLFLTDLKGHDVILGKLAATSVNAFYGMLALLPMLAIPFIVGGVSRNEMLRVVLVSLNLLFFFLSIGLFVSAACRRDHWALGLSILIGLACVLGGPGLTKLKFFHYQTAAILSSPATGCFLAFDSYYAKGSPYFWLNAVATNLYAWIFFGLACWVVPRSWQNETAGSRTRWWFSAPTVRRARARGKMLEMNPFLWRVARKGGKRTLVWIMLVIMVVIWLWSVRWLHSRWMDPGMDLLLLVSAGLVLKAWLAAEAGRTFSEDRRDGGLELLLCTPLNEADIVRGQLAALKRQFGPPVAAILLAYLFFLAAGLRQWTSDVRLDMLEFHLIFAGFLAADMMALSWVGMWLGLTNRSANRAALLALTRILVLPGLSYLILASLWVAWAQSPDQSEKIGLTLWILLGLSVDAYFGVTAKSKLHGELRMIVAEGPARKPAADPIPATAALSMQAP